MTRWLRRAGLSIGLPGRGVVSDLTVRLVRRAEGTRYCHIGAW